MDRIINWSVRAALPLVLAGLLGGQAMADATGRAGESGAVTGQNCGRCHTGAMGAATVVAFGGVPASVVAGSVNTFTFTVSGGPALGAGLGISATGGMLGVTGTGTKILSTEVVHSAPTAFLNGSVIYTFTWTAPATAATVTLFGAGVSSNTDAAVTLDGAATTSASITVTAVPAPNVAPTALFTGPITGNVGIPVTFDGKGSTDTDGTIATWDWNFGDGAATGVDATGVTATHSYAKPGTYPVKLTVTDNMGATGTVAKDIVITAVDTHVAPVADAGGPYTGTAGTAVAFDGSKTTVSNGLTGFYTWDFGDNTPIATISVIKPTHVYAAAGTYTVKLTVVDDGTPPLSSTVTTTAVITAVVPPPPPPPISTGQELYETHCASCHGPKVGPAGPDGSVAGVSAGAIREAIEEKPAMKPLQGKLSANQIFAIATYLKPDAKPSRGEQLYSQNCAVCHGAGGTGGDQPAVVGASEALIKDKIRNQPEMALLIPLLRKEDAIEAIAKFLGGPHDGIAASSDSSATDSTFLEGESTPSKPATGALDWLSMLGAAAWGMSRRRKK